MGDNSTSQLLNDQVSVASLQTNNQETDRLNEDQSACILLFTTSEDDVTPSIFTSSLFDFTLSGSGKCSVFSIVCVS
jgi:hypothetical protein